MANITPRQFTKELEELAGSLRDQIEAEVTGFTRNAHAQQKRRSKAVRDFGYFANTYFPHYIKAAPSFFHQELYRLLPPLAKAGDNSHLALAAPRGEGKSTLVSQIFVIWCVITDNSHYALIIMDSYEQAVVKLEEIKAEFAVNPRLRMDFAKPCKPPRQDREGVVVLASDVKLQALGSGKRLRGLRHGPHRPDLVVLDDIENDDNVRSPAQRDKLEGWVRRAVLPLGPAEGGLRVVFVGTLLHYDSVLARFLKNPLWQGATFQAVISWPSRLDLWGQWETIYKDKGNKPASGFYKRQKGLMNKGAVVSWPTVRPLERLMQIRADSHSGFAAEYQNDPVDFEDAAFRTVQFWSQEPKGVLFGAVDPSLGKYGKSRDPSAVLVGSYDRSKGILGILEASIAKRQPNQLIDYIISLQRRYACVTWFVEAVQFQEFLRTELMRRAQALGVVLPARPVLPKTDKVLRIESLQPAIADGLIQFHPEQKVLLEQLRHFPRAAHDDGPDALQMLWEGAVGFAPLDGAILGGHVPVGARAFGGNDFDREIWHG